jgi:Helix-turn-helix domain
MQNPPGDGGRHPTSVGETLYVAVQSFPKIRPEGKRILATGGLTPVPAPSGRVCATRRRIDVPFSVHASCWTPRREKVFGHAPGVLLDRNAKARIMVYVRAYNARMRQEGQHTGPVTRAFMDVLRALLYSFHNGKDGRCFPSYERIAEAANCCRATVYEAIRALEKAGVLTWVNRLTKIRVPERDLFGRIAYRWQVIRTSNSYRFLDPKAGVTGAPGCKSENPSRPMIQESLSLVPVGDSAKGAAERPDTALERTLTRLSKAMGVDLPIVS